MIMRITAGIHNRRIGLSCCNLTDTYCFNEIASSTLLTSHCMLRICCVSVFLKYITSGTDVKKTLKCFESRRNHFEL